MGIVGFGDCLVPRALEHRGDLIGEAEHERSPPPLGGRGGRTSLGSGAVGHLGEQRGEEHSNRQRVATVPGDVGDGAPRFGHEGGETSVGLGDASQQVEPRSDIGATPEVEFGDLEFVGVDLAQGGLADPISRDEIGCLAGEGISLLGMVGALGHGEELADLVDHRAIGVLGRPKGGVHLNQHPARGV
jgi:hypothetical protein